MLGDQRLAGTLQTLEFQPSLPSDQGHVRPLSPLLALVHAQPGATQAQLQRSTGQPWGTLWYRIGLLAKAGLVNPERDGKFLRVWPASFSPAMRQRAVIQRLPLCQEVLDELRVRKELGIGELVEATGRCRASVARALSYLQRGNYVEAIGTKRKRFRVARHSTGCLSIPSGDLFESAIVDA